MDFSKLIIYCKRYGYLILVILLVGIVLRLLLTNTQLPPNQSPQSTVNDSILSHVNNFKLLPFEDNAEGKLATYGEDIIKNTFNYFYKDGKKIGNRLACTNCHLQAGTKAFAAPYIGISGVFPVYIGREDKIESLEERINGCFERSMNAQAIPENGKEMRAIITYIKKLSNNTTIGKRTEGQGFVQIILPERKADFKQGSHIFQQQCKSCHGENGQGKLASDNLSYIYPPLWGDDSYNDGAGMARIITAARFIKANMPLGTTFQTAILSDDEAYDVAAYINSFERPQKANKEKDYPNLSKKPKDCGYPPYIDTISHEQHKYGPFNF